MVFLCSCPRDPSLSGTVIDKETSNKISGAKVDIVGQTQKTTAEDGHYEYPKIGSGVFEVKVTHDDYEESKITVTLADNDVEQNVALVAKTHSLTGKVTDSKTNAALQGVTVKPSAGSEASTGSDGQYSLTGLKKGSLSITFSKDGFKSKTEQVDIPNVTSRDVALEPYSSTLTGKVTNSRTGQAVSGAVVSNGADVTSTTGGDGVYTFSDMRKTSYTISATKSGYKAFPATNVTVDLAQPTKTFDFTMVPIINLTGTVTSAEGGVLSGVTVTISGGKSAMTNSSGVYTISDLTETSYQLTATKSGYKDVVRTIATDFGREQNVENITMTAVQLTTSLTGTVTSSGGSALSGITVTLNPGNYTATTGSNGTYRFDNLTQSSYTLTATGSGYNSYSATVPVNLSVATNTHNITMTATGPSTTSLTGTVTSSGSALSGVTITLNPGNYTTTTGSGGTYRIDGLTQSSYTLTATRSGYNNFTTTVSINTSIATNTYNFVMTSSGSGGTCTAAVTASVDLVISNGVNVAVSLNAATSQLYDGVLPTAIASSASDNAIISALKDAGSPRSSGGNVLFYNLDASTAYTYCAIPVCSGGSNGTLTRLSFTTKGSSNQPRATLTASKSGSRINFSATKNSYCSYYMLWYGSTNGTSSTDIYYATLASRDGDRETSSGSWYVEYNSSYTFSLFITLGYTSSNVNSGVIDVTFVNNSTGAVTTRSAQVDLRSFSPEDIKMLKIEDMEGMFVKAILKSDKK